MNKNVGCYMKRSIVSVPSLNILASSDEQSFSQGPNTTEIIYVRKSLVFSLYRMP